MIMEMVFLGTASMVPTKDRNHSGLLIMYGNETILIDCGEGIQRQFRYANISPTKITRVLITHWHGDHVLGLPGLIQTLGACEYRRTLEIYGPVGSRRYFGRMLEAFVLENRIKVNVHEVAEGVFFENSNFRLRAMPLEHNIRCVGYALEERERRNINVDYIRKFGLKQHPVLKKLKQGQDIEWKGRKIMARLAVKRTKGRKIAVVMDTSVCKNAVELAKDSDIFICEATFGSEFQARAEEYRHLTAVDAAGIAKKARVKKLFLTHFSQRYKTVDPLEKEARDIFKNSCCARDMMRMKV